MEKKHMSLDAMFGIDQNVLTVFPEINVAVAIIHGVTVQTLHTDLEKLKSEVLEQVRTKLAGVTLSELPKIKGFRMIYKKFGVDPSSKRPSAEALVRRVISDPSKGLYSVNTVVDSYNLSSCEFQLPMAAYDLDRVEFPISLRFAAQEEKHLPIGQANFDKVKFGELVYGDKNKVLCRNFNYRDSDITKVTNATKNVVIFVDGCSSVTKDELKEAICSVTDRIIKFNGGQLVNRAILP
jgi:DNA/RNA-binding domain of Phe-tRNA-synthetase-like protein